MTHPRSLEILPHPSPEGMPQAMTTRHRMAHSEEQIVDLTVPPLHDPEHAEEQFGLAVPTLARVKAGNHEFSVLDLRDSGEYTSPLLLVDGSFHYDTGETGYKGIWPSKTLSVGRDHHADRFNYDPTVSKDHFTVAYHGLGLFIANQTPTNSTLLSGNLFVPGKEDADDAFGGIEAAYTANARDIMRKRQELKTGDRAAPYGYYKNHPVIGRESPSVKNGVYFTVNPNSEAVVVDDESRTLQQATKGMLRQVGRRFGRAPTVATEKTLELVNKYTDQLMPYDLEKTEKLSAPHYKDNGQINLSEYVENKAGVCRHQCLLAAFLLETLVDKGVLVGRSGVERNHDIDAHGAHAWAIFEQPNGTVYVVDPAQGFVGTKEEARAKGLWKYDLPVER